MACSPQGDTTHHQDHHHSDINHGCNVVWHLVCSWPSGSKLFAFCGDGMQPSCLEFINSTHRVTATCSLCDSNLSAGVDEQGVNMTQSLCQDHLASCAIQARELESW